MFADYHLHSYFSDDSAYPLENVVKDAISLGLDEICLTDHCEYVGKLDKEDLERLRLYGTRPPLMRLFLPEYLAGLEEMRKKYRGKIIIRSGIEFGMQKHTIPLFECLYGLYDFDFVILSIHQVGDKELWRDYQEGRSQEEYNRLYYEELLYCIERYKDYSLLGHMDLIARYDKKGDYPFFRIKPYVEQILKMVIEEGKGIEINASSHRYGLSDTTPSRDILKLYKDLGGEIITVGTDSHSPNHMARYIRESREILKNIGFKAFCTFEGMKPHFHDL